MALSGAHRLQRRRHAAARTGRRCCSAESRIGAASRTSARRAPRTASTDGSIDAEPTLQPDPERYPEELWGIEDPRITFVDELGKYAIAYTAFSRGGPGVALALTEDFRRFERLGLIMQPDDKDAALLPRRIDGNFALIHRPMADSGAHVWISYSPDLRSWGGHKLLLQARKGGWWDANKVGLSPPLDRDAARLADALPRRPSHRPPGVSTASVSRSSPSTQPDHCLARGDSWIFGPEAPYEREGDVGNVAFPCGYTLGADGDTLNLYYGAADTSMALATGSIRELLAWLDAHQSA